MINNKIKGVWLMLIMSQDKKIISEFTRVKVDKNYSAKKNDNNKYAIIGETDKIFTDEQYLGYYENEELAIVEMENIYTALNNREQIYAVK